MSRDHAEIVPRCLSRSCRDQIHLDEGAEQPEGEDEEEDQHEEEREVDLLEHVHHVLLVAKREQRDRLQHRPLCLTSTFF